MPGTRFNSRALAEKAELERKINSGSNGQRVRQTYVIEPCGCNGFHLMNADQAQRADQQTGVRRR